MKKIKLFFMLMIIIKSTSDTLGPNLLINHDFSTPIIQPYGAISQTFSNEILGWNCTAYCEIDSC